jgi:hypothetical protein
MSTPTAVRPLLPLVAALLLAPAAAARGAGYAYPEAPATLREHVERAAAGDLAAADELRAAGPAGLSALLDAAVASPGRLQQPAFHASLDRVCAQVDCHASRLYWYTDLAAARRAAQVSGRAILSLRLLGRLDEELSCANSRYFRTLLYSDPAIATLLRERVVLHWSSERPVPRVTVDFGDGRRLVGTVTGNSIHYLLDARGRVVDALPGLHSPQRFRAWVEGAAGLAARWGGVDDEAYLAALRGEHQARMERLDGELTGGLSGLGWQPEAIEEAWAALRGATPPDEPTAADAAPLALTKARNEGPLLTALGMAPTLEPEVVVAALAARPDWAARLSRESRRLALARAPRGAVGDPEAAVAALESLVAADGVRNEAVMHRAIHQRLAAATAPPPWPELNAWVYAELFLTPASDPWLGLAPSSPLATLLPEAE